MIQITKSFKTSDGTIVGTIEEAQQHELEVLITSMLSSEEVQNQKQLAAILVKNKAQVIDCLTMKPSSRPLARKANGATKKRKAAVAPKPTSSTPESGQAA